MQINLDIAPLQAQLSELAQIAETSLEVRELLLDALDSGRELTRIDVDDLPAPAGELRIRAQLSDGLLELLLAARAGNVDALVVQQTVHGAGASDEC